MNVWPEIVPIDIVSYLCVDVFYVPWCICIPYMFIVNRSIIQLMINLFQNKRYGAIYILQVILFNETQYNVYSIKLFPSILMFSQTFNAIPECIN